MLYTLNLPVISRHLKTKEPMPSSKTFLKLNTIVILDKTLRYS